MGEPGELCVGGAGVSRGYWRREELTRERFVPDPAGTGGRLYRTGDQARQRSDGLLEFLGRMDDQLKLRGYRIEPGEIENVLTSTPEVRQAAVTIRANHLGDRRLVAYLVPVQGREDGLDQKAIRAYLRDRLPAYMVPAVLVPVAALPVTPNGKINRVALPEPEWEARDTYA